jgi:hypothetical protein
MQSFSRRTGGDRRADRSQCTSSAAPITVQIPCNSGAFIGTILSSMADFVNTPEGRSAVAAVTQELVALAEPSEAEFVQELVAECLATDSSPGKRRGREDPLGFGVGELLAPLTPLACAMVVKVGAWLGARLVGAGAEAGSVADDWVKKKVAAILGKKEKPPAFSPEQLQAVREQLLAMQPGSGIPLGKAKLMADALVGRLAVQS